MRTKSLILTGIALLIAALACSGQVDNMRIENPPRYVCPSATPRPTDTPYPTSTATYPAYFNANLREPFIDAGNRVWLQLTMQNAGQIYVSYSGQRYSYPYNWPGTMDNFAGLPRRVSRWDASPMSSTCPPMSTAWTLPSMPQVLLVFSSWWLIATATRPHRSLIPVVRHRHVSRHPCRPTRPIPRRHPMCARMIILWAILSTPQRKIRGCGWVFVCCRSRPTTRLNRC